MSHISVSSVMSPVELVKSGTERDNKAYFKAFIAAISSSLSGPIFFGWSLRSILLNVAASRGHFETKRRNT